MTDAKIEIGLGFGGNLGQPEQSIKLAIQALNGHSNFEIDKISGLYETPPWGEVNQPNFINACALGTTSLSPAELLTLCKNIEDIIGREDSYRWGPRLIDIDILFYGDLALRDPDLIIPHKEIARRAFVLVPLAELAPTRLIGSKTVSELLSELPESEKAQITPLKITY